MKQKFVISGDVDVVYTDIMGRRSVVTGMNKCDEAFNIPTSQRSKYEAMMWKLVVCLLPSDIEERGSNSMGMTFDDLVKAASKFGIVVTKNQLRNTLYNLINLKESIHPHRRNIGVSCYDVVKNCGGIKYHKEKVLSEKGRPAIRFWLGGSHEEVSRERRSAKISLKPKLNKVN